MEVYELQCLQEFLMKDIPLRILTLCYELYIQIHRNQNQCEQKNGKQHTLANETAYVEILDHAQLGPTLNFRKF